MTIKELYIENFGRLSAFRLKLTDGLNTIVKENGFGKTTLAAFIKAMLYGLDDNRKQSLLENERKRYTPWQGGAFGGWLIYENGGEEYRVERSFGTKASADTVRITRLRTGEDIALPSMGLGRQLFDIDAEGFEKTVFLSERNIYMEGAPDTVSAKLAGITGVEGDLGGFDAALELLDKRRKIYFKKGGSGEIKDAEERVSSLEAELRLLDEAKHTADQQDLLIAQLSQRISELKSKRCELLEKKKKCDENAAMLRFAEEYRRQTESLKRLEEQEAEVLEFFKNGLTDNEEVAEQERRLQRARSLRATVSEADTAPVVCPFRKVPTAQRITELSYTVASGKKKRRLSPAIPAILAVGAVISGILGAVTAPALFILCAVLALGAVIASVAAFRGGNAQDGEELRQFFLEVWGEEREGEPLNLLISMRSELDSYNKELKRAEAEASERSAREKASIEEAMRLELGAEEFLSRFPTVSDKPFEEIRQRLIDYSVRGDAVRRKREECERFRRQYGIGESERLLTDAQTVAGVLEELSKAEELIKASENEKLLAEANHRRICDRLDGRLQIEAELAEAKEYAEKCKENYSVITKTAELLASAKTNMTSRYLHKTRAKFQEYAAFIEGEEGEFTLDTDFSVKKVDMGAARATEAYSRGTRELYLLAVRLALIFSLYGDSMPPIILDDPFIAFDDGNARRGLQLLSKIAADGQIIYLSCSKSRV